MDRRTGIAGQGSQDMDRRTRIAGLGSQDRDHMTWIRQGKFEKAIPLKNQLYIRIASSNRDEIFISASQYTQLSKDIESAELLYRGGDANRLYLPYIFRDVYCNIRICKILYLAGAKQYNTVCWLTHGIKRLELPAIHFESTVPTIAKTKQHL